MQRVKQKYFMFFVKKIKQYRKSHIRRRLGLVIYDLQLQNHNRIPFIDRFFFVENKRLSFPHRLLLIQTLCGQTPYFAFDTSSPRQGFFCCFSFETHFIQGRDDCPIYFLNFTVDSPLTRSVYPYLCFRVRSIAPLTHSDNLSYCTYRTDDIRVLSGSDGV